MFRRTGECSYGEDCKYRHDIPIDSNVCQQSKDDLVCFSQENPGAPGIDGDDTRQVAVSSKCDMDVDKA